MNHITTPVVRGVVTAYRHFYSKEHTCQEAEGSWPYLFKDGQPVVCKACEWAAKQHRMQERAIASRLSMPVHQERGALQQNILESIKDKAGDLFYNPLGRNVTWKGDVKGKNSHLATTIANHMAMLGHVVFYVHRSQAINLIYGQRETEAEDVLLYAPVLVFWNNNDKRENGRIEALIEMRSRGFTFILGE